MNNKLKMVQLKKEQVLKRQQMVDIACQEIKRKNEQLSYRNIALKSNIPIKTLEREPYKSMIKKYKGEGSQYTYNPEINVLNEEIKYLNLVIKKLREENKNLLTFLYTNDKI